MHVWLVQFPDKQSVFKMHFSPGHAGFGITGEGSLQVELLPITIGQ